MCSQINYNSNKGEALTRFAVREGFKKVIKISIFHFLKNVFAPSKAENMAAQPHYVTCRLYCTLCCPHHTVMGTLGGLWYPQGLFYGLELIKDHFWMKKKYNVNKYNAQGESTP